MCSLYADHLKGDKETGLIAPGDLRIGEAAMPTRTIRSGLAQQMRTHQTTWLSI